MLKMILSGFVKSFRDFKVELPGVDEFVSEQVSIPVGWWLTESDLSKIINTVVEYDQFYRS